MSNLRLGDVCVIVKGVEGGTGKGVGLECVIFAAEADYLCTDGKLWFGFRVHFQDGSFGIQPRETLKRIPPKSDPTDTYDGQFAPCEKDWLQDFQRTMKVTNHG